MDAMTVLDRSDGEEQQGEGGREGTQGARAHAQEMKDDAEAAMRRLCASALRERNREPGDGKRLKRE